MHTRACAHSTHGTEDYTRAQHQHKRTNGRARHERERAVSNVVGIIAQFFNEFSPVFTQYEVLGYETRPAQTNPLEPWRGPHQPHSCHHDDVHPCFFFSFFLPSFLLLLLLSFFPFFSRKYPQCIIFKQCVHSPLKNGRCIGAWRWKATFRLHEGRRCRQPQR